MVDIEDDHLGGAAGLAARLDHAGEGVVAAHEARPGRRPCRRRDIFSRLERRVERLEPAPEPNLKSIASVLARSMIEAIVSWTELMKQAEHCGCASTPTLNQTGELKAHLLVDEQVRQLGLEGAQVLVRGEVVLLLGPLAMVLTTRSISWRTLVSRPDVPRWPRKYLLTTTLVASWLQNAGTSTSFCSKTIFAPLVADRCGPDLPLDLVVGVDARAGPAAREVKALDADAGEGAVRQHGGDGLVHDGHGGRGGSGGLCGAGRRRGRGGRARGGSTHFLYLSGISVICHLCVVHPAVGRRGDRDVRAIDGVAPVLGVWLRSWRVAPVVALPHRFCFVSSQLDGPIWSSRASRKTRCCSKGRSAEFSRSRLRTSRPSPGCSTAAAGRSPDVAVRATLGVTLPIQAIVTIACEFSVDVPPAQVS